MQIQIVQDLTCPWCYVGHHNLKTAIADLGIEDDLTFEWYPYLLDPIDENAAPERFRERFRNRKGVSEADMGTMFDRVTQAGKAIGLDFRFDRVKVAVNTVPGHAAIAAAPAARQGDFVDALHLAYFTNGQDIGQPAVILEAAREAGLTEDEIAPVSAAIASPDSRAQVRAAVQQVQMAGVTSVPYVNIGDRYGLSGGQPAKVFKQALEQARQPEAARV